MLKTMPARVTVKNADSGEVEAVFATLNVIDKDGDVILPGAIAEGTTVALSSAHKAWEGAPAVGAGTIHEVGDELIVKGQYFMDTDHGRNAFYTIKGLAEHGLGEWSWSLEEVTAQRGAWKTDNGTKPANIISKVGKVAEVSDVFRGAGQNTRTLVVKSDDDTDDAPTGVKFSEHLTAVLADVKALADRAEEVMALRAAKGKNLSDEARDALGDIAEQLARVKALTEPNTPNPTDEREAIDVDVEFARFVAFSQGVPL